MFASSTVHAQTKHDIASTAVKIWWNVESRCGNNLTNDV